MKGAYNQGSIYRSLIQQGSKKPNIQTKTKTNKKTNKTKKKNKQTTTKILFPSNCKLYVFSLLHCLQAKYEYLVVKRYQNEKKKSTLTLFYQQIAYFTETTS